MTTHDPGSQVWKFLSEAGEHPRELMRLSLSDPRRAVKVIVSLLRVPVIDARLSDSPDGRSVRRALARRSTTARRMALGASTVIMIPATLADYLGGVSKRSLRKKLNAARRLGVIVQAVDDDQDRLKLLTVADEFERSHPVERYRSEHPRTGHLLTLPIWLAAYDDHRTPVALAVATIDGEWAVLNYLRILSVGEAATVARYTLVAALVEVLVGHRVRYLGTDMSPILMPTGLRVFQDRVGFTLVRIRMRGGRAAAPPVERTQRSSASSRR